MTDARDDSGRPEGGGAPDDEQRRSDVPGAGASGAGGDAGAWWSRPSGDAWAPRADGGGTSPVPSNAEYVGDADDETRPLESSQPAAEDWWRGASYAGDGGSANQGYTGQGHAGQSYAGQGYAAQGYPAQGYAGQHVTQPQGYAGYYAGQQGFTGHQPQPGQQGYAGQHAPYAATAGATPWGPPTDTLGQEPRTRRGPRAWLLVALVTAIALVAGSLGGVLALAIDRDRDGSVIDGRDAGLGGTVKGTTERDAGTVAAVAARLLPSVVSFEVRTSEGRASGSGFVIREDGYILTNNHVVRPAADGAGEITVQFDDGKEAEATIVGRDDSYDLAVVKISARNLPVVTLGDSDAVVPGDAVLAIGSPLGLSGTVTQGIISALDRPVTAGGENATETSFISAIQTDAAINPGNSGGPLVNLQGEVIGVNSAIATLGSGALGGESGSIGLGFAIPMKQAKITAEELITKGKATHPVIGVSLDPSYAGEGARVADSATSAGSPVREGGPADAAGIEPGDVILEIDGQAVSSSEELIVSIRSKRPGDVVELVVSRNGNEREVSLTLGASSE